jgi:hypothetical protein
VRSFSFAQVAHVSLVPRTYPGIPGLDVLQRRQRGGLPVTAIVALRHQQARNRYRRHNRPAMNGYPIVIRITYLDGVSSVICFP